uniref:Acrosin-binding protein n=1 Tax=Xenopus tropicalis TaxID=8364 RepID=F6RQX5_XENTR
RWGPALGWRVVFPVVLLAQSNPALKFAITPGTPLSNKEYEAFFKPQKPKLRAIAVCKKRMAYGCDEPRIHRIDLWENHGAVPTGTVCTELIYYSHFDSFCEFAKFRCLNKLYYVKVRTWRLVALITHSDGRESEFLWEGGAGEGREETQAPGMKSKKVKTVYVSFDSFSVSAYGCIYIDLSDKACLVFTFPSSLGLWHTRRFVCDSWGRQHMDMFPFSAFCSLKVEQCKGSKDLLRVPCTNRNYKTYLSPSIPLDSWTPGYEITTTDTEFFAGLPEYSGHSSVFWCARLALSGCQDLAVSRWLSAEYAAYQMGDFPDQICDSEDSMYPTYCAFKSRQCLMKKYNQKVSDLFPEQKYTKFSEEEAEELVQSWINKYDFS